MAVVCSAIRAIAAMSEPAEIVVIVCQRLWNQPLMSHPRRSATAPITNTITAHRTIRRQSGRGGFAAGAATSCAAAVT